MDGRFHAPTVLSPQERVPGTVGTGICADPTAGLVALETRNLASARRRTKVRLTSCPQCVHYTHYSLPGPYREYLIGFPSVLSIKLRLLQEFLLHLLDILGFSLNLSADQIFPVAVQQNSDCK